MGDARDEPNHSPVLVEPPEGRGIGAMLGSLGITLPTLEIPGFAMIRNIILGIVISIAIFFVMFMILAVK